MKKRVLSILLALALVFTLAPMGLVAHAETYEGLLGRNIHYSINATNGVMTVSGSGPMEDYNQCPVSSYSRYIKKIIVEPGVTRIGNSVFEKLYDLVGVSLPDTVTEIGENAFYACYDLKSCPLPSKLKKIGYYAFGSCMELVGMTLPNTLKELDKGAFNSCEKISSINIPDGVKEIPYAAFANCRGLKKITIGKGVKKIGGQAFDGAGLTSVVLPANVTELEHACFSSCKDLKYASVEGKLKEIPKDAFAHCKSLEYVKLPKTIETVDSYAFWNCPSLLYVDLSSVKKINGSALGATKSLKTVIIGDKNCKIRDSSDTIGKAGITTIYGRSNSTALDYALKYGLNFKDLSAAPAAPVIPGTSGAGFTDVKEGQWYTEAVKFVTSIGLMKGKGDDYFDLNSTTTRAEIVTMLYRYEGEPAVSGGGFSDVTANWAEAPTKWAASKKVVNGVGNNKFNPNGKISCQDFATMLYNYAKFKGCDLSANVDLNQYGDGKNVSKYAQTPMKWAIAKGVIVPSGSKLNPKSQTSRAQAAVYLKNFCDFAG